MSDNNNDYLRILANIFVGTKHNCFSFYNYTYNITYLMHNISRNNTFIISLSTDT